MSAFPCRTTMFVCTRSLVVFLVVSACRAGDTNVQPSDLPPCGSPRATATTREVLIPADASHRKFNQNRVRPFDFGTQAQHFVDSTTGPAALGEGLSSAGAGYVVHSLFETPHRLPFQGRAEVDLARNGIANSIRFSAAALLRQDQRMTASHEHGVKKRAAYALIHSVMVSDGERDRLAMPRFAEAFGTACVLHDWHPWQQRAPNVLTQASWTLGRYMVRSYWTEFSPEIKRAGRTILGRKLEPNLAVTAPTKGRASD